jgi:hypothetical protein
MSRTVTRVAALAAVAAMGLAAPATDAIAAFTPPTFAGLPFAAPGLPGLPAFNPAGLAFVGPSVGQVAAVIGPTVITTAPSQFVNTNLQTTAGGALSGGQVGP